jgi:hypothetical protein
MPYRMNYPRTVAEVLDDSMTFKPGTLRAVRALRRAKAWRGSTDQRLAKLRHCLVDLAAAYSVRSPALVVGAIDCYVPAFNMIQLTGGLSVTTFLHEFAHVRGFDERQACRWSINLFRRVFPRSYARCRHVGHLLVSDRSLSNERNG